MDVVKTGMSDLDRLLGGGFPSKTAVLISGDAGSGKTLFGLNFVIQGAKTGERCCYISLSETEEELLRACKGIEALADAEQYLNKNLIFKHIRLGEKTNVEEFIKTFAVYPQVGRLVIDNVNKLLLHATNSKDYRLKLVELIKYLKEKASCTLLLCETKNEDIDSGNTEAFETDGIIKLSFHELEEKPKRILQVYKFRYASFDPRIAHEFVIDKNGVRLTKSKII